MGKPKPVCATCNDTHLMTLGEDDDCREVMCTRCPVPCQDCRSGGNGPYCAKTPCSCACHGKRPVVTGAEGELVRLRHQLTTMRAAVAALEIAMRTDSPIGHEATQALLTEAGRIVSTVATHDAYWRAARGGGHG